MKRELALLYMLKHIRSLEKKARRDVALVLRSFCRSSSSRFTIRNKLLLVLSLFAALSLTLPTIIVS